MKMNNQKILQKAKMSTQNKKLLAAFLVTVILLLSVGLTQKTLGKFARSFMRSDVAKAAKFDVEITGTEAFWWEQGERVFEYHFLSGTDIQGLSFQITNNGETDMRCKPYITNGITYRVYVAEEVCADFVVAAKETVSFWLALAPNGLDTNIRDAEFFIDIQQMEGR